MPTLGNAMPKAALIPFLALSSPPTGRAMETMARSLGASSLMSPKLLLYPASGGVAVRVKSGTQTLSFGVDELGRDNLDFHFGVVDRADSADNFAHTCVAGFDKAKADGMPETGRPCDRGHPPLIVGHIRLVTLIDEMRARD